MCLILETTYGRPHFRFGDPDETVETIARWCRRALDSHVTPVLLCHALGKTEEVMLVLARIRLPLCAREALRAVARSNTRWRAASLPDWIELNGEPVHDRVVIAPPVGKDDIRRLGHYRTALISGWAKDPDFARLFGAGRHFRSL
jgi:hypothetical protein